MPRALLIVDMLKDFVYDNGALTCGKSAQEIVPYIQQLARAFREQGDRVIYVTDAHDPEDPEFSLWPKHCVRGTWGAEVIDELKPEAKDLVVPKTRYSGFFGTNLEELLQEVGASEVHVTGVCTSICVLFTVADLRNRDFATIVHARGVADFDQEAHRFALRHMERVLGARVLQ
ncbi:MAG: cysteine hydrolase [candidate division KSB1 bacterium]|nr:cysteine hydrolase [candidate division KSB1 bacterium]